MFNIFKKKPAVIETDITPEVIIEHAQTLDTDPQLDITEAPQKPSFTQRLKQGHRAHLFPTN